MEKKPAYNQEWLDMEMKRRLAETPIIQCKTKEETPAEICAIMKSTHPTVKKSTHIFILHALHLLCFLHLPKTPENNQKSAVPQKSAAQDRVYGAFDGWARVLYL